MSSLASFLPYLALANPTYGVVSQASVVLREHRTEAERHFYTPVTRQPIGRRFAELAATWKEEREFSSSMADIVMNPSYQSVIALGRPVVPYILADLTKRPDHWFWALTAITGANPIPIEAAGNLKAMTEAWLAWGDREGQLD